LRRAVGIGEIRGAGVPRLTMRRAGVVRTGCDAARVTVGGHRVGLRIDTDVRTLDHAGALLANACGGAVPLRAGHNFLAVADGPFRVDMLRLRSGAPAGLPAPRGGGAVVAPGKINRASVDGARVDLRGPSWLVLGQSFDRGWRASCDERPLGAPVVIDGYANGWRAPADCHAVRFWFAPQTAALWLEIGSGAICLLLTLGLALYGVPQPEGDAALPGPLVAPDRPARWPLGPALLAGLGLGVVLGFLLAIRVGVLIAPAAAFALWRGVSARTMAIAAAVLLAVAVPAVYLLHEPPNHGGYDFNYAVDLIAGHWLAVAAIVLLFGALVRTVAAARSSLSGS
jgi:arabinofuranan 3-O-arabinosyltransferase